MNDSLKNMKPKKQKINSKYTEDWLPIKAIANGTIVLDNNMKVTGVKITPRNIFILDQITQENVIVALKNFYNTLDFEFWIISADRPVDISAYLAQLQLLYNSVNSTVIRKMIMQDLQKANMFMDNNVTDTEYFLLFKEKNPEVIQKRLRTIMMGLANAGLTATQTSNSNLESIMENFLNGGMNTEFGTVISS